MDHAAVDIALWGLAVFTAARPGVRLRARGGGACASRCRSNPLVERGARARCRRANCGACGFAGCQAYAEAVVEQPEVPPNLCAPGRAPGGPGGRRAHRQGAGRRCSTASW